jgi:hypothetical protein
MHPMRLPRLRLQRFYGWVATRSSTRLGGLVDGNLWSEKIEGIHHFSHMQKSNPNMTHS